MKMIELSDGTLMRQFSPLEDVPFYSTWLEALLVRRAAFNTTRKNPRTHVWEPCIMPYDGHQEQAATVNADGSVGIICIGCAKPFSMNSVDRWKSKGRDLASQCRFEKIRIGGIVQFGIEEPIPGVNTPGQVSVLKRWRRRPVSKSGLGCPACTELYAAEDARVSVENASKQCYADALRTIYAGNPEKLATIADPKLFTAFLDILSGDAMDHAQQFSAAQARNL